MPIYAWEKYNLVQTGYKEQLRSSGTGRVPITGTVWTSGKYSIDQETGMFSFQDFPNSPDSDGYWKLADEDERSTSTHPYAMPGLSGDALYKADPISGDVWFNDNNRYLEIRNKGDIQYGITVYITAPTYGKGTYVEDIYSNDHGEYPQDGVQDGYWYVFKETIPDVPSITVPGASMTGQQVSTAWGGGRQRDLL